MTIRDPSILLLSPDEGTRATFRELLRPLQALDANSAEEASQAAADHSFDILVLDIDDIGDLDAIVDACYGGATTPVILAVAPREAGEALLERVEAGVIYRFILKPFLAGQARLAVDATLTRHADGADPVVDIEVPELPVERDSGRLVLLTGGVAAVAVLAAAGAFLSLYSEDPQAELMRADTPATKATVPGLDVVPAATPAPSVARSGRIRAPARTASYSSAPGAMPAAVATPISDTRAQDRLAIATPTEEVPASSVVLSSRAGQPGDGAGEPYDLTRPVLDETLIAQSLMMGRNNAADSAQVDALLPSHDAIATMTESSAGVAAAENPAGYPDWESPTEFPSGNVEARVFEPAPETTDALTLAAVAEPVEAPIPALETIDAFTPGAVAEPVEAAIPPPAAGSIQAPEDNAGPESNTLGAAAPEDSGNDEFDLASLLEDESRPLSGSLAASASTPSTVPLGAALPPVTDNPMASDDQTDVPPAWASPGFVPDPTPVDESGHATDKTGSDAGAQSPAVESGASDRAALALQAPWNDTASAGSAEPFGVPAVPEATEPTAAAGTGPRDSRELVRTVYAAPEYPRLALQRELEGWVVVRFSVGLDGIPTDVDVVDSKPRKTFDRAAVRAIRDWRYNPAVENGQYVRRDAEVRIQFDLN